MEEWCCYQESHKHQELIKTQSKQINSVEKASQGKASVHFLALFLKWYKHQILKWPENNWVIQSVIITSRIFQQCKSDLRILSRITPAKGKIMP